jgi:flagellin
MRDIAVQSASDTNDDTDRGALDGEYQQLLHELDDIARETRFNGTALLSDKLGGAAAGLSIQTGPDAGDMFSLALDTMTPDALGIDGTHVRTGADASAAIGSLDDAINQVSTDRANLGAVQAWLDCRIACMNGAAEDLAAADSRIRDADVAEELVRFTQARLLAHISTAMMAQGNALAGNVLYLLAAQMASARSTATAADAGTSSGGTQETTADEGGTYAGGDETGA